jgi:hypothetical protein
MVLSPVPQSLIFTNFFLFKTRGVANIQARPFLLAEFSKYIFMSVSVPVNHYMLHYIEIVKRSCMDGRDDGTQALPYLLGQCFSNAGPWPSTGPWHQLYWALVI